MKPTITREEFNKLGRMARAAYFDKEGPCICDMFGEWTPVSVVKKEGLPCVADVPLTGTSADRHEIAGAPFSGGEFPKLGSRNEKRRLDIPTRLGAVRKEISREYKAMCLRQGSSLPQPYTLDSIYGSACGDIQEAI